MFDMHELEAKNLVEKKISLPEYHQCLKASHVINNLDATVDASFWLSSATPC